MPIPRIRTGRLSDLVSDRKTDWSDLRKKLKAMEPGEVLIVTPPPGVSLPQLRCAILVCGRRIHTGDWRVSTRTKARNIHCFLAPVTP